MFEDYKNWLCRNTSINPYLALITITKICNKTTESQAWHKKFLHFNSETPSPGNPKFKDEQVPIQLSWYYNNKIYEKRYNYEGWNFNSGNYLFTTDIK